MNTFEAVDTHVSQSAIPEVSASAKKIDGAKLKQIYATARPILSLVAALPIIPKKWKAAINTLITALDLVTGGGITE